MPSTTTPEQSPEIRAYGPVVQGRTMAYDWMRVEIGMPESCRTVLAWNSATELPCVVYFDNEQNRWHSQHDGVAIDNVTDWMHYLSPTGADSGSRVPLVTEATGGTRAADLTPDEQRLVGYFRSMDDRARQMQVRLAKRYAEDWPQDFVTMPAELKEPQNSDSTPDASSPSSARDLTSEASVNISSLDDALDNIADDSDNIDCALSLVSDLLRVALNECERVGDEASYVETVIRAALRYGEDVSESNMHLQRFVAVLEGKAQ